MFERNITTMIILFLVTFGIYPLIWSVKFQSDLEVETGEGFEAVGHFLMLIFTFGIYAIYWNYAAGKRLAAQGAPDNSILYLILSFTGIGALIVPFLLQTEANKLAV